MAVPKKRKSNSWKKFKIVINTNKIKSCLNTNTFKKGVINDNINLKTNNFIF